MIIVAVEVVFAEEETTDRVRDAFRIMDEATQNEQGCIKCFSSVDVNDSTIVRIYEL